MLRIKTSLLAAALAAAVSVSAVVYAEAFFDPRGPMAFATIDADRDGYVTAAEYQQHRSARHAARTAQGRMLLNAGQSPSFTDWDADGDGRLTSQEVAAGQQTRFLSRRPRWGRGLYALRPRPCWR